mmetsp:Transcript_12867/g.31025  ORF Transcript_12867/g.31025 Transcript_12867/m.31025 type:complete len:93 (+) Transcript_12867:90-368(+)
MTGPNDSSGAGRTQSHGPFKCHECGEMRDKKDFSQRQLQLPMHNSVTCRHCNEAEKFAAKEERRLSLDESKEIKPGKSEIHNKAAQNHQPFS